MSDFSLLVYGSKLFFNTLELHLYGLCDTASHPDMKKIRIIGFFFEYRLLWQF